MNTVPQRLRIERVSKHYGARRVLQNVSAELAPGDVLLVTGHNGVGKSTLLRLLAGLQQPSSGTISYEASGVTATPVEARPFLALVGPDLQLYRELTAREHLRFVVEVRGMRRDDRQLDELLAEVGLGSRGDELVGRFSSGMLQRLRYALALLVQPGVLLLDEPTTNLDTAGVELVDRVVAGQRQRGITVIATNDRRDHRYGDFVLPLGEA